MGKCPGSSLKQRHLCSSHYLVACSYGFYEGKESHEVKEGVLHCQGPSREGGCVSRAWKHDKDQQWLQEGRLDEEQDRQDHYQEAARSRQKGLQEHQGMVCCFLAGQEGLEPSGLRAYEEGHSSIQGYKGNLRCLRPGMTRASDIMCGSFAILGKCSSAALASFPEVRPPWESHGARLGG